MNEILELLDEVLDLAGTGPSVWGLRTCAEEIHACDGCGVANDIDLWATDTETGGEVWLCETCGS